MRGRLLLLLPLAASALALAQQTGQNRPAGMTDDNFTLTIKSQLVVETVTVRDKQGRPVHGLTAKDFTVTEDGAPQTVRICSFESLAESARPLPPSKAADEDIHIYKKLNRTRITPERADDGTYANHRLLALYFDMSAMRVADQFRALRAAEQFIRTQMNTVDLVSILRYNSASVDILQDFTADRSRLLSVLETLVVGEGQESAEDVDDAGSADTGAAFGQDDSEFNVFNTDRQLSALQTASRMLGEIKEKKSLIYFAGGLRLNGIDNQAQLHATVDSAIKAGVSFWPIDSRGLVAEAPLGDATQGSAGNANLYTGAAALAETSRFQISQDTLYALASDTGGKALLDSNDLDRGIVNAQDAVSDYYVIGYYTTNNLRNGKFRHVHITLAADSEAKLDYRQGYFAEKEFSRFTATDKERQLEDALMLDDPITDLSLAVEIDYFQLNRAEYFVPVVIKIPGRELALAKRGGAEHTLIDFVGEIKDVVGGVTITNVRDNVNIKLSDATAAELVHRPIEYDGGFTLLPGKYLIKLLARDDETGRIGTYETTFTIPNLNKEVRRVPISSVVLSSQRVDLHQALYDAARAKDRAKDDAVNPLVQEGRKLVPSVTRVFSARRELFVFLQAYRPSDAAPGAPPPPQSAPPLIAYVSLYSGDAQVFRSAAISVAPTPGTRLGVTPLSFTVGLNQLAAGQYRCQVTVLDPSTAKASFWSAPIVIAQ